MRKIIFITSFALFLFSCENREEKIELYLLKERVRSIEGIPLIEYAKVKGIPLKEEIKAQSKANYDTVKKQYIYAGKFDVEKDDIQETPLIEDSEIIGLNLITSELEISQSGRKKIEHLKPNMKFGTQFVLCVNGKPSLTGYFRSNISSYIFNWNYIGYNYFDNDLETQSDKKFVIRKNDGYDKWLPVQSNLGEYPTLISAFKKSNRLIN